jgi:hypothetical protein
MTFVGGETLIYFNIEEFFTVLGVEILPLTLESNLWAILKP